MMPHSITSRLQAAALLVLSLHLAINSMACADEPRGEVRYFFEVLPYHAPDSGHDLEAAGSRRIVSHYEGGLGEFLFGESVYPALRYIYDADGNVVLDMANTTWMTTPVLHITDDGIETLDSIYWLIDESDDPQSLRRALTGATAATGPGGDVVTLAETGLRDVGGYWYLAPSPEAFYRIRVSMGWFQK